MIQTIPDDAAKALSDFAVYAEYLCYVKTNSYKELAGRLQLNEDISTSRQLLDRHAAAVERAKEHLTNTKSEPTHDEPQSTYDRLQKERDGWKERAERAEAELAAALNATGGDKYEQELERVAMEIRPYFADVKHIGLLEVAAAIKSLKSDGILEVIGEQAKEQVKQAPGTGVIGDSTTEPSAVTASASNEIARPPEASANSGTIPAPVPAPAPAIMDDGGHAKLLVWLCRYRESVRRELDNLHRGIESEVSSWQGHAERFSRDNPLPALSRLDADARALLGQFADRLDNEFSYDFYAVKYPDWIGPHSDRELVAKARTYLERTKSEPDYTAEVIAEIRDDWKRRAEKAEQELAGIESEMEPYCGDDPKPSLADRIKAMHRGYDDAVEELAGSKNALDQAILQRDEAQRTRDNAIDEAKRELAAENKQMWSCIHNHTRGLMALSHRVDAIEQSITLNRKQ